MKKIILSFLLFFSIAAFAHSQDKIAVTYFYNSHCKACYELKADFLPEIEKKYQDRVSWRFIRTDENPEGLGELLSICKALGIDDARVPAILVGNKFLMNKFHIQANLEDALQEAIGKSHTPVSVDRVDTVDVFNRIPLSVIILSGLIDGINPCAFAVIIFFISFLAVYGYQRREVVFVGSTYCLSVFITYFLIGLGIFQFLYTIRGVFKAISAFYLFVASICFILAGFAFYDYYRFRKTKQSKDQILQLPDFLKKRINKVIGIQLRGKKQSTPFRLIISTFIVGLLVSLLEAVCTGQIYIPIIVSILKYPQLRIKALSYLLVYNLMFVLPLVLIFLLSLFGFSSQWFNNLLKKNLGKIKILMALIFVLLGLLVLGFDAIYAKFMPYFKELIVRFIR
ncbi:MAG: hypothetical protein JW867_06910 [Candidatus Omnitrophica bacterium]|nr:hypothetical protein [Candidatus Omnitrophota bacterium]